MAQRGRKLAQPITQETFEALALKLEADDYRVRSAAVDALGKTGDPRAAPMIHRALADPRKRVRARAVQALGRIGGSDAFDALAPALHDRTATVRSQAVEAIGKIGTADDALGILLPMLNDPDADVVYKTVDVCAAYRDSRVFEPLLCAARTEDTNLLGRLIAAVAPYRDLRTVVLLCDAIASRSRGIARLATHNLSALGDSQTLPRALLRREDLPPRYKLEALEALRGVNAGAWFRMIMLRFPLPPIPEFCARMEESDPDPAVRRGARQLLDHANLLRGSQPERNGADLLRAASAGPSSRESSELMRGSECPHSEPMNAGEGVWQRIFQRNRQAEP